MIKLPGPIAVIAQALRDWWDDWVNMILINLVWFLCWVTVLLGPPATMGVYYVTNQLAHGRSVGLSGLLEGGRRWFARGWLWMLINLGVAAVVVANYLFYQALEAAWAEWAGALILALAALWLVTHFYALPYLMEQEHPQIRLALRNGLFTALAAPGYTLVLAIFVVVILGLSVVLVLPLLLGTPCLVAVLGNRAVIERLAAFQIRERDGSSQEGGNGGQ